MVALMTICTIIVIISLFLSSKNMPLIQKGHFKGPFGMEEPYINPDQIYESQWLWCITLLTDVTSITLIQYAYSIYKLDNRYGISIIEKNLVFSTTIADFSHFTKSLRRLPIQHSKIQQPIQHQHSLLLIWTIP